MLKEEEGEGTEGLLTLESTIPDTEEEFNMVHGVWAMTRPGTSPW